MYIDWVIVALFLIVLTPPLAGYILWLMKPHLFRPFIGRGIFLAIMFMIPSYALIAMILDGEIAAGPASTRIDDFAKIRFVAFAALVETVEILLPSFAVIEILRRIVKFFIAKLRKQNAYEAEDHSFLGKT